MLTCGIVGLPAVGKTTLFNLLTGAKEEVSGYFTGRTESHVAIAPVPDRRISFLSRVYQPNKTTYAQIQVSDVPGLVRGASKGEGVGNKFLADIRNSDAIVQVVRAFSNDAVMHAAGSVDPMRDILTVNSELLIADLQLVETRLERLTEARKLTPENKAEIPVLEKIRDWLFDERLLKELELSEDERHAMIGYGFFTNKPLLLVVNTDEEQMASGAYPGAESVRRYASESGVPLIELSCRIEAEIAELGPEDRQLFMEEYSIQEPGIYRLARAMYDSLGLISFFTVGKDEVRAWTIPSGTNARRAGRAIHSDIEKGFIRAEVVAYDDFVRLGSMASVKEHGLFRLEGQTYVVQDGDIINFRFNV